MHFTHRTSFAASVSRKIVGCTVALLAGFSATNLAAAQTVLVDYPLITDLLDASGTWSPVTLTGNPPPTGPNNGVCSDGSYLFSAGGGQDVRTDDIFTLDTNDFEIELEFQVTALGATDAPILMGGFGWRWIGFYTRDDGTFALAYNNSTLVNSSVSVTVGTWHSGLIKYENGSAELYLDCNLVLQTTLPALNTGNDLEFTTNDGAWGRNFNGCIRNLVISNDTTLGVCGGGGPTITLACDPANDHTGGNYAKLDNSDGSGPGVLHLECTDGPANEFGYFLVSATLVDPGAPISNGLLCLVNPIGRYAPASGGALNSLGQFDAAGVLQSISGNSTVGSGYDVLAGLPTPPGGSIMSGETWHFQCWYRDGNRSNFSNAISVTF